MMKNKTHKNLIKTMGLLARMQIKMLNNQFNQNMNNLH